MIRSIKIENFKSLRSFSLDPGRFTVLVGPNGAGKTSVLQALHLISQVAASRPERPEVSALMLGQPLGAYEEAARQHLDRLFGGVWAPERLCSYGAPALAIRLTDSLGEFSLGVSPQGDPRYATTLDGETARIPYEQRAERPTEVPHEKPSYRLWNLWEKSALRRFEGFFYLRLEVSKLTAPSPQQDEQPRLGADGSGLASVLNYLAGAEPDTKAAIEADLRRVVPQVRGIRTKPAKISVLRHRAFPVGTQSIEMPVEEGIWGQRFFLEMAGGAQVPAEHLSEGTVIALGLLTLLHGPDAPGLLLLDDMDRALHLGAQVRLVEILRGLLEQRPGLQVIGTSHSPFLLQGVSPQEVMVMAPDAEGWTHVRRLDKHPDYERFRAALGTGELWATLGEDWVLS